MGRGRGEAPIDQIAGRRIERNVSCLVGRANPYLVPLRVLRFEPTRRRAIKSILGSRLGAYETQINQSLIDLSPGIRPNLAQGQSHLR